LDGTGKVPQTQLPTVVGGDMTKAVYDTNNNGVVDTCDSVQSSRVIGLGTAATLNVPASGNATTAQIVLGTDTRLGDIRTPSAHAASHIVGGSDQIQLVTTSIAGLCVPPDGTTIQITGGKLVATTTGSGDMLKSIYDTNNDGIVDNAAAVSTHVVPPSGNASVTQIVLGSDTRLSDTRTPIAHASTHNGGADPIPLASASAQGLCPAVDNTTIQVAASKLSAILATNSAPGIVRPDNSSITIAGGIISSAGSPPHGWRLGYTAASNQPITTANTWQAVNLITAPATLGTGVTYDIDSVMPANASQITIKLSGIYSLGLDLVAGGVVAGSLFQLGFFISSVSSNNNLIAQITRDWATGGIFANAWLSLQTIVYLAVNTVLIPAVMGNSTSLSITGNASSNLYPNTPIFRGHKIG
jgi:hypothetical protein